MPHASGLLTIKYSSLLQVSTIQVLEIFEMVTIQASLDDITAQVRKSNNSLQHRESRLAKLVIITTIKTITLLVTLHLNYLLQFRAIIIGTIA